MSVQYFFSQEVGVGRVYKLLMRRIHVFDDLMKIQYRGVVGSPTKRTKMDQNTLKWSLYHDRGKCFEFVLSDLSDPYLE